LEVNLSYSEVFGGFLCTSSSSCTITQARLDMLLLTSPFSSDQNHHKPGNLVDSRYPPPGEWFCGCRHSAWGPKHKPQGGGGRGCPKHLCAERQAGTEGPASPMSLSVCLIL